MSKLNLKDIRQMNDIEVKEKLIDLIGDENYADMYTMLNQMLLIMLLNEDNELDDKSIKQIKNFDLMDKMLIIINEVDEEIEKYNKDISNASDSYSDTNDESEDFIDSDDKRIKVEEIPDNVKILISSFVCSIMGDKVCTPVGLKIADGLIRVAAMRIFSVPEQSIMELIANSVDAYRKENGVSSIGKFGMGFFSILYWISPKQMISPNLSISSTYRDGENLISYNVDITWCEEGLNITKQILEIPEDKTSTLIKISYENYDDESACFTYNTTELFEKYIYRMSGITDVNIFYNDDLINAKVVKETDDNILVEMEDDVMIYVNDFSSGIPLDVLYNSLLVPSSSSKNRIKKPKYKKYSHPIIEENKESDENEKEDTLKILVNGVTIIEIKKETSNETTYDYTINLPPEISLPVSREDIIYEEFECEHLKNNLMDLISDSIEKYKTIVPIIDLLDIYLTSNKQENLFKLISELKVEILSINDIVFIPKTKFWEYFSRSMLKDKFWCFYQYANIELIYDHLKEELDLISIDNIFKLRKCIIMELPDEKLIESNEFSYYTFINVKPIKNFETNNEKMFSQVSQSSMEKLMMSSNDTLLIPFNDNDETQKVNMKKIGVDISKVGGIQNYKIFENSYSIVSMTVKRKFQNITLYFSKFIEIIIIEFNELIDIKNSEDVIKYNHMMTKFNSKLASIKLNFPYGTEKSLGSYMENNIKLRNCQYSLSDIKNVLSRYDTYFETLGIKLGKIVLSSKEKYNFLFFNANTKIIKLTQPYKQNIKNCLKSWLRKTNKERESRKNILNRLNNECNRINIIAFNYFIDHMTNDVSDSKNLFIVFPKILYSEFTHVNSKAIEEFIFVSQSVFSEEETIFLLMSIRSFLNEMFEKYDYKNEINIDGVCSFMLSEYRRKYSNDILKIVLDRYIKVKYNANRAINNIINNDIVLACLNYYNTMIENNVKYPEINIYHKYNFTCKSMLSYMFNNSIETIERNELFENITQYNFDTSSVKLQIVEIAVNEGTSKIFSQSVITELLQNSVDAIKSSKTSNTKISISTYSDAFSIKDEVGFSDINIIIPLLIPFISSKNANDPDVTGEMGTGFFNVYRQPYVKYVLILTAKDGIYTSIKATPMVKNGNVYDINYEINTTDISLDKNGTNILVVLRDTMPGIINDVNVFVNSYLGTNVKKTYVNNLGNFEIENKTEPYQVFLNGVQKIKSLTKLMDFKGVGEVYSSTETFKSYVTTNNIPFCSLSEFIVNYPGVFNVFALFCDTSVVINIDKDFYEPSQSRSKINVKNEDKILLLLNDGLYLHILNRYLHGSNSENESLINFTCSNTNVSELNLFDSGNIINFNVYKNSVRNFNQLQDEYSLANIFQNYCISLAEFCSITRLINLRNEMYCTGKKIMNLKARNKDYILQSLDTYEKKEFEEKDMCLTNMKSDQNLYQSINLLFGCISKWYSNKDTSIPKKENTKITSVRSSTGKSKEEYNGEELILWTEITLFIDIYWKKIHEMIKSGFLIVPNKPPIKSPNVANGKIKSNALGFYQQSEHIIVMNEDHYSMDLYETEINKIKESKSKVNDFQKSNILMGYYASNSTTTLIHEIGHAIQGTTHKESSHGRTDIKFKNGNTLEFDDMCLNIYRAAIDRGLLTDYISKL